jgi:hypothetical protein
MRHCLLLSICHLRYDAVADVYNEHTIIILRDYKISIKH